MANLNLKSDWHKGYEVLLAAGPRDADRELTEKILKHLHEEFLLKGAKMAEIYKESPADDKYRSKDKRSTIIGQFPVGEVRFDSGEIALASFNKEAIYYITHPYNPAIPQQDGSTKDVNLETTIKQMLVFGDTIAKNLGKTFRSQKKLKLLSAVVPVTPYDLNHSVERNAMEGLIEGNTLKMFFDDLARYNYNEFITICPHSNTPEEYAGQARIKYRSIDPFRGESKTSPNLGPFLYTDSRQTTDTIRSDYKNQVSRLTPFVAWVNENFGDRIDDLIFVATDDGGQDLIEDFTYAIRGDKQNMVGIIKERDGPNVVIKGFEGWSTADLNDLGGKIAIVPDDKMLTGNTLNKTGYAMTNQLGIKEVYALIGADMTVDKGITGFKDITKFIFLETNPNSLIAGIKNDNIERMSMDTTALLHAAAINESYSHVRTRGGLPKVR